MQLSYRGISYQSQTPAVSVTESPIMAKFRGHTYPVRQSAQSTTTQLEVLTYRGARYLKAS
ncbi:DUF4278 domain-containing protein [Romeria aff. gracilis LEGE 07310]|uniref:DUF4278 domain-containing protein n=1 Tax=Vasconcelosia minhoensis LEGE 07310 TaxID=915328 RepID=A0A8J7DQC1_9CYAN|nr:DUF4278 domain-containing protein [Romeria gracilis]MBE9076294.1 DUF4278 domain-containing protein [Romeria aff. gracilis LEGE 07310]